MQRKSRRQLEWLSLYQTKNKKDFETERQKGIFSNNEKRSIHQKDITIISIYMHLTTEPQDTSIKVGKL